MLAISTICALFSGASSIGLLVTLSSMIAQPEARNGTNALCFLVFGSARILFQAAHRLILGKRALLTEEELRGRLMHLLLVVRLRTVETIGRSAVMSCLADDVSTIGAALHSLPNIVVNAVIVSGSLIYLAWLAPQAFVLTSAILALGISLHVTIMRRIQRHSSGIVANRTHLFKYFNVTASGAKELRLDSMRRTHLLAQELVGTQRKIHEHSMSSIMLFTGASILTQTLFTLTLLLLLMLPYSLTADTTDAVARSAVVVLYAMGPVEALVSAWPILAMASAALRKIDSFGVKLTESLAESTDCEAARMHELRTLDLKGVVLSFPRNGGDLPFVLGPIDLRLSSGEVVFLTGGNGSGKTTLAKLITGLYPPEDGKILIDGCEDLSVSRDSQRRFFGAIFSDYHLFDTILPCDREASDRILPEWLALFGLTGKVRVVNGVIEHADKLSTGQRKRVALALALMQDRPAYLFDEWAADQDPYYRKMFYDQVLPELRAQNKLVVVISHDDAYFDRADRIVSLRGGNIDLASVNLDKAKVTHAQ